ncbi:MAG: hypothetical protein HY423_04005 [Candidatus Lambdaproteobacteria bacterium]|nr:hypothetical protein [Candidatus Lambdaproteobacteria bacterium]
MYMAALAAARYNPVIRAVYLRLRAKGKPAKVGLLACMRKLPAILNAMARDNTVWRQTAPAAAASPDHEDSCSPPAERGPAVRLPRLTPPSPR